MKLKIMMMAMTMLASFSAEAVRREAPLQPNWQLTLKDARFLNQMVQKNKWFQDFRQSALYSGAMQKISPVLFSLADEYGPSAHGWKGRLLDYAYDKILEGQPIQISYFNRHSLVSPVVISVFNMSSAHHATAEGLIRIFRSSEDKEVEIAEKQIVKVTPLYIRGEKFALVLRDKCLVISRDPKLAAVSSLACAKLTLPSTDAQLVVSLPQQFPTFEGLREKFFSADNQLKMDLKWNSSAYRLEPMTAQLKLKSTHPLLKTNLPPNALAAMPANTFFYASTSVPGLKDFSKEQVAGYFKENKANLIKRPATAVTLFYSPYLENVEEVAEKYDGSKSEKKTSQVWKMGTGLLIHAPQKSTQTMEQLSGLMKGQLAGEIFMRPVCKDMIVLFKKKDLVRLVDEVCAKRRPSVAESGSKSALELTKKETSASIYFSPGKLLSQYMENAWSHSKLAKKSAIPNEIKQSEKLVEALPEYQFSGIAEKEKLVLKSTL